MVEDIGFVGLISETTDGRYIIPSRKKFTYNILPTLYTNASKIVCQEIKSYRELHGCNCIFGVTTDAWTSTSNTSFITYTLHLIKDYKIVSFVIDTKELSDRHTADNLRADLLQTLLKWGVVDDNKVVQAEASASSDESAAANGEDGEDGGKLNLLNHYCIVN